MKTENENLMTQYLLGELSEDEKLRLEEQFFTNDDAFEQLLALEDELRYDYANGGLTPQQRRQFEQRFLSSPGAGQQVAVAKAVLEKVAEIELVRAPVRAVVTEEKPGFFQSLLTLFGLQNPLLQFALTAASILLLLGGSWLFYQTVKLRSQVQELEVARTEQEQQRIQQEQQAAEARARGEQLNEQLEAERRKREELEQALARQKAARANETSSTSAISFLSFILTPGLSRDIDSTKRLTIPANVNQVRLRLNLKRPGNYPGYQAVLQTLDGAELWQRNVPRTGAGQAVNVSLPARLVPPGDYVLILKGRATSGEMEELDEYYFNVVRQ
jgi:hypothetical protein